MSSIILASVVSFILCLNSFSDRYGSRLPSLALVCYFFLDSVEGSEEIWDDLLAFRKLDEQNLTNFFLVAEYVRCIKL